MLGLQDSGIGPMSQSQSYRLAPASSGGRPFCPVALWDASCGKTRVGVESFAPPCRYLLIQYSLLLRELFIKKNATEFNNNMITTSIHVDNHNHSYNSKLTLYSNSRTVYFIVLVLQLQINYFGCRLMTRCLCISRQRIFFFLFSKKAHLFQNRIWFKYQEKNHTKFDNN